MAETLLSPSNVLLFGRVMDDLTITEPLVIPPGAFKVIAASTANVNVANPLPSLDTVNLKSGKYVLLKDQATAAQNGIYEIVNKKPVPYTPPGGLPLDVYVRRGSKGGGNKGEVFHIDAAGVITKSGKIPDDRHGPFARPRTGLASELEQQLLLDEDPTFARIYGFSFEGFYYDLPWPVVFLVHGEGYPVSEARTGMFGTVRAARAPGDPSQTGLGQADFQFADDIMVWSYDKADYTIRMDVETGMFEDVLLAAMLGGPGDSSGMNARGMNARGMNARGMNARGMNARGMNARGMNARGGNGD
ncbi:hypothetical protein [Arvimicrobium flavum]|uniref:hypothetical protein n=1 Tax=Arvimicrobium flavum TaxID=3393320 RepID=UPI00237B013A|nr:hypothetical protein [Mesorhizobium shangrilense]